MCWLGRFGSLFGGARSGAVGWSFWWCLGFGVWCVFIEDYDGVRGVFLELRCHKSLVMCRGDKTIMTRASELELPEHHAS